MITHMITHMAMTMQMNAGEWIAGLREAGGAAQDEVDASEVRPLHE